MLAHLLKYDTAQGSFCGTIGEGNHAANAAEAIEASYAADKTDEFVLPCVTCEGGRVLSLIHI